MLRKSEMIVQINAEFSLTNKEKEEIIDIIDNDVAENEFANLYLMIPGAKPNSASENYYGCDIDGGNQTSTKIESSIKVLKKTDTYEMVRETTTMTRTDENGDEVDYDWYSSYYVSRVIPTVIVK